MELRHLRAFVAVVSEGHFGKAAALLHLSQPALTQRINALERELGMPLLERNAREVRPTRAGEVLLPFAQNLVLNEDAALRNLKDLTAGNAGSIRIAYTRWSDTAIPGRIVAELRRSHPGIEIHSSSGTSTSNLDLVASGDVDAAFVWMAGSALPGVTTRWVGRLAIVLALGSSHRLAQLNRVPISELASERFVMYPRETNPVLFDAQVTLLERHTGGPLKVFAYEPREQALEAVGTSDSLISPIVGTTALRFSAPGVTYRELLPSPMLDFGLAFRKEDPSPIVAALLKIAEDLVGTQPPHLDEGQELMAGLD